ncbi:hypothetical protein PR048_020509 [Dryococelus australis]|uniref:PiggyBac transposable element-derived protein domain-containing protein n=1 Tax=Dryococelus australis TaxID=614101 RepID=A0ABQ9H6G2_9NEOP|nr:hypothetical protein PR048_020509 [Dryococelus australis]
MHQQKKSDHNTDSEQSEAGGDSNRDSQGSDDEDSNHGYWYSKSRFKWAKAPPTSSWTNGTGRDIFRATMSLRRIIFLLYALRFDDVTTLEERRAIDCLAPISELFNELLVNCQSNYCCGEYPTVDEILVSFRAGKALIQEHMARRLNTKISHELRSTINRVRGITSELNRDPQAEPRSGPPKEDGVIPAPGRWTGNM